MCFKITFASKCMKKLVWVSVHDFLSAQICAAAGVDTVLVGDSLGMTVYGFDSTHHVTIEMMLAHAAAVRRAIPDNIPAVVADLPIDTYSTPQLALQNARRFREIGITHLKLEGGAEIFTQVEALIAEGIKITGHLGMLPQTTDLFALAATSQSAQKALLAEAHNLQNLGISNLVLECVPAAFAAAVTQSLSIPVIGIGAGTQVSGQVLVYADIIGRTAGAFSPRFLRRFGNAHDSEQAAITDFVQAVQSGEYPQSSESYL